jgi:hypothetical protein
LLPIGDTSVSGMLSRIERLERYESISPTASRASQPPSKRQKHLQFRQQLPEAAPENKQQRNRPKLRRSLPHQRTNLQITPLMLLGCAGFGQM